MAKTKHYVNMEKALAKGDMDALRLALTPRQLAFCQEYIVDHHGTAAAIRAGYSSKYADRQATQLLDHPGIREYINHLKLSVEAKAISVDPDWVLGKITSIVTKDRVRDSDALRGLELISKILGMLKERHELSGPDGDAIKIKQVEEDAQKLGQLINNLAQKKKEITIIE